MFDDNFTDPMVDGQLVAAGIGCYVPFLKNPYAAAAAIAPAVTVSVLALLGVGAAIWVL